MKKIKVAEVITRLDWGGSPDIVRVICGYLNSKFYDVTLVTGLTRYPGRKTKEFLKNFSQKIVVIPELKRELNPISDLATFIRLYLLFRRQKFDIVHTHTAKAGALGRVAAFLAGRAIIVHTSHGHNFYGYFGEEISKIMVTLERILTHFTDKIVVLTELEKKDLLRFKVAEAKKICLIPPGLELDNYAKANIDKVKVREIFHLQPDETVVGMVARLEPIKGPEYFVEAAKEVVGHFNKTRFIIVGEGSLRQSLEERVKNSGLKERFIFTGWCEDIIEVISIFDILVLPSLNEAVGMVLIEAQSLGVPVIATNVGGIAEIIQDNQTGILVPPRDPQILAGAINSLLVDKQKRLAMSEKAKAWVRDKFKAQDMADRISGLYQELIASKK